MAKSKKAVARPASPSANEPDPEEVLEDEPAGEPEPEEQPASKKKSAGKKRKAAPAAEEEDESPQQAQPPQPKKKKGGKKAAPPPEPEPGEEEEEQAEEGDEEDEPEIDPEVIAMAFKQYRAEHRKLPTAEELAEALECDVAAAAILIKKKKRAIEKVTNERKAAKIKGYYKGAVAAGYGNIKDTLGDRLYSMANAKGTDSLKPLLSMSDMLRLATFVPAQPTEPSYDPQEFEMRLDCMDTTLPVDAARELLANADAVFKQTINRSVAVAMQQRSAQMIKPSHGLAWMKPIAEKMMYSSINAPAGLVAHAKAEGVLGAHEEIDAPRAHTNKTDAKANGAKFKAKVGEIKKSKIERAKKREQAKQDREKALQAAA